MVQTFSGLEVQRSPQVTVDVTPAGETIDGVDIAKLAAMFGSSEELCVDLAAMPGAPHTNVTTTNDPGWICLVDQAAGKSIKEIIADVAARGGAAGVAGWLIFTGTPASTSEGDPPTYPPPPPPPPARPYTPEPPQTLPDAWDAPIAQAAQQILALNPAAELTDAQAAEIARHCAWLAAEAALSLGDCGKEKLPIFVSGASRNGVSIAEATKHDLRALGRFPAWFKLNYEKGTTKTNRRWYSGDPDCAGSGAGTGNDCDEFPFFSTEQGGQFGALRTGRMPDLEPVASLDNQTQGRGALAAFYSACAMRTGAPQADGNAVGGDAFLVLPLPPDLGIPAMPLCNRKSGDNQP